MPAPRDSTLITITSRRCRDRDPSPALHLSRIASQEGEIQPQGWVGGGLPASVLVVALPLWPIAAQCFELLG